MNYQQCALAGFGCLIQRVTPFALRATFGRARFAGYAYPTTGLIELGMGLRYGMAPSAIGCLPYLDTSKPHHSVSMFSSGHGTIFIRQSNDRVRHFITQRSWSYILKGSELHTSISLVYLHPLADLKILRIMQVLDLSTATTKSKGN